MGRTLHYSASGMIADEQWDKIDALQDEYNVKNRWTCEHLDLSRLPYWYPRWPKWYRDSRLPKDVTVNSAWEIISDQVKGLTGVKLESKVRELVDNKYLAFGNSIEEGVAARGFTKVADNEANAKLVVDFLIESSRIAKDAVFRIYDEGDYILCSYIVVKQGVIEKDDRRIEEYRKFLAEKSQKPGWEKYFRDCISKLENGLMLADTGIYFNRIDDNEYADHPQFRTLNISVR